MPSYRVHSLNLRQATWCKLKGSTIIIIDVLGINYSQCLILNYRALSYHTVFKPSRLTCCWLQTYLYTNLSSSTARDESLWPSPGYTLLVSLRLGCWVVFRCKKFMLRLEKTIVCCVSFKTRDDSQSAIAVYAWAGASEYNRTSLLISLEFDVAWGCSLLPTIVLCFPLHAFSVMHHFGCLTMAPSQ